MANTNKFEELLNLVINEETEKAEQLFHDIVVEKSREIYQGIVQEDVDALEIDETKEEESKEEDTTTEAKKEEKDEDAVEEAKDETQEETTETVGGDATDNLVSDIEADEAGADAVAQEDEHEGEEHGDDVEDKVDDLEAAIEELKAEFEKMKAGDSEEGDEEEGAEEGEEETAEEEFAVAPELATESKEVVREYTEQKSADNKDHSDKGAKSPIGQAGAPKVDAKAVQTSTKEDTGRTAPAAKDMGGTTKPNMKEVAKPDNSDKADNKKSAVSGK